MANKIVNDSHQNTFVHDVQLGNGETPTKSVNDLVRDGAVAGLVGDTPRKGEDGYWYAPVDTGARVRLEGVTGAYGRNAPVYVNSAGNPASSSASGALLIGFAYRQKGSGSGDLWVQLVPSAGVAAA